MIDIANTENPTVTIPGGLEFEPQRLRGFSDFQGFK